MYHHSFPSRILAFMLCFLLLVMPTLMLAQDQTQTRMTDYLQGKEDGKRDGKGSPGWLAAGLFCGIFGFIGALSSNPSPPAEKLMGKSSEYILGYTEGYKSSAKTKNIYYACGGWALLGGIYLIILLSTQSNSDSGFGY